MINNTINDDKTIAGGIGTMLAGRYRTLRQLDEGGMGSVWLAEKQANDPAGGTVKESQNTEFKQSWHDEYLKWICGFANAKGGKLLIGVDDAGQPVGVANAKKLLEDIPNKIRDTMGIVADFF